jgi:hypothetical protein
MGYPDRKIVKITRNLPNKISVVSNQGLSSSHRNRPCVILGGGPSLQYVSPELWKDYHTIGVNKSILLPYVDTMYFMDIGIYTNCTSDTPSDEKDIKAMRQAWRNFSGTKYTIRSHRDLVFSKEVIALKSIIKPTLSRDIKNGIYSTSNSGSGAIMLAIALGFNIIHLLGFDLSIDDKNEKTHWHSGYFRQEPSQTKRKLNEFIKCFETVSDLIKSTDIEIYNLNKNSALEVFPKISIDIL